MSHICDTTSFAATLKASVSAVPINGQFCSSHSRMSSRNRAKPASDRPVSKPTAQGQREFQNTRSQQQWRTRGGLAAKALSTHLASASSGCQRQANDVEAAQLEKHTPSTEHARASTTWHGLVQGSCKQQPRFMCLRQQRRRRTPLPLPRVPLTLVVAGTEHVSLAG